MRFFSALIATPVHEIVDRCYDLAHLFRQDPDVFLNKTLPDVLDHLEWAARLMRRLHKQQDL